MLISQTGNYKKRGQGVKGSRGQVKILLKNSSSNPRILESLNPAKGFTLLELILVVFIISLALSIVMPSLDIGGSTLKAEARHIGGALRYINDEATGKKQTYLFNVNLNDESWGFEGNTEKKKISLRGNAEITDILIPSLGEVSSGEVIVEFGPMGADEPIILHIKKGKSEYTIIFNNINGRAEIVEGYTL